MRHRPRPALSAALVACAALLICAVGMSTTLLHPPSSVRAEVPTPLSVPALVPMERRIDLAHLPAPFATPSANNGPGVVPRPDDASLFVPKGFRIASWADGLDNPRVLAVAPDGDVFVAESRADRVSVLHPGPNGMAGQKSVFLTGLKQPFGLAFYPPKDPKFLYVANTDSVVRVPYQAGDLKASAEPETITTDLPGGGYHQHWTRRLLFSPDGKTMYVSVGSQSNVGEEEERRAAILAFSPTGGSHKVYASGLRNPVGIAFSPTTGKMWTAVNERDGLGDDLVPDYATSVTPGGFYGWPYYYMGANHDPRMPDKPVLAAKTLVPDVPFESHAAALSICFYTGSQFPSRYRGMAFVGMHGSWNRSHRSGYKVVCLPMTKNGNSTGAYEDFVTGWATPSGAVWGRPVDVAQAKDGSLLITDDGAGKIWRVTYQGRDVTDSASR